MEKFDPYKIREEFPILSRKIGTSPLVYLDNGATTQKPSCVIDALADYYRTINANVHRGVHALSQLSTDRMEMARERVRRLIGAEKTSEVIFTRGATESINLVASSLTGLLKKGDEILLSGMEHHSNIVPWQLAAEKSGAVIRVIPLLGDGTLDMEAYAGLLSEKTRMVAVTEVSNVLGTVNPIQKIVRLAHRYGAWVLVDGAQGVPHRRIDVKEAGVDFYAFSGHKMYGPTGIGVLYGREELLEKLPPYQGGGDMIGEVRFEKSTWADLPFKFEAGTPNIEGAIGLDRAIDFIDRVGYENIEAHEKDLLEYAEKGLSRMEGIEIYGRAPEKSGVLSFNLKGIHPFDVGTILDQMGIAVRTGHHCAQPLMDFYGIPGTVRASFALYNTREEVEAFLRGVERAGRMLR